MLILTEEQIRDRVKNPKNREEINKAHQIENELKAFCTRKENQEYIHSFVKKMVVKEKYDAFVHEYLNATIDIVDQVRTQYKKVFNAHERNINFEFSNPAAQTDFIELRKTLYNGESDNSYFEHSTEVALYMPHNLLFVIPDPNRQGSPNVIEYNIKRVWDIESTKTGIDFVCFEQKEKDEDIITYFGADGEKYFSITTKGGLEIDSQFVFFDNINECPTYWVWNQSLPESNILKKSLLHDSISTLYDYSVTWNGNAMYKRASSYPTEFRAKAQQKENAKKPPNKSNSNIPTNNIEDFLGQHMPTAAYMDSQAPKNPAKLGATVELDILRLPEEKLDQYIKSHFRLESDKDILKFHEENIEKQRKEILAQVCGHGFGQSTTREAINVEQVMMNFDNQEANLDRYRDIIQLSWKSANETAAKIFSSTFEDSVLWLGDEYFLRSVNQLNAEVKEMKTAGYPQPDILEKMYKIRLTQNKHNPHFLKRAQILSELQPLQSFDNDFIKSNGQYLQSTLPRDYSLYINFQIIVSLFEQENGKIQDYKSDMPYQMILSEIREIFYNINSEFMANNQSFTTLDTQQEQID